MKKQILRNLWLSLLSVFLVFSVVYWFSGWQGVENANTGDTITATVWNNLVNGLVKWTGSIAETISWVKTFSDSPIVPSPTASWEVASKGYVDSNTASETKNYIINGNFDIWQRGTSFTQTNGNYTADRWRGWTSGATATFSRQSFSLWQTDVPFEPTYYMRINSTSADDNTWLLQYIEDVRTLAGQTATLSFYAKADSSRTFRSEFQQDFWDGWSSFVVAGTINHSVTTSRQKFTHTLTIPSIAWKTVGPNSFLNLVLVNPNNETFTIDVAQVQVERWSTANNFQYRNPWEELNMAQRYYEKSYDTETNPWTATENGAEMILNARNPGNPHKYTSFKVTKRTIPTLTIYSSQTWASGKIRFVDWPSDTNAVISRVWRNGATIYSASSTNLWHFAQYHYTADAELY